MSTKLVHIECPICDHQPIHEKSRMAIVKVPTTDGYDDIPYEEEYCECPNCHTIFIPAAMMDKNLKTVRQKYHANAVYTNGNPEIISSDLLDKMQSTPHGITTEIGLKNQMTAFFKKRDLVIIRESVSGKTEVKRVNNWHNKTVEQINHILNTQEWS